MKTVHNTLRALALLLFFAHTSLTAGDSSKIIAVRDATLKVDPSKSVLNWTAQKIGGVHTGNVTISQGTLTIKANKLTGGTFTMDMNSITSTDVKAEGMNKRLVNHLKSEDFFSAEAYPHSVFTITKAEPIVKAKAGEPNYTITGDLTIKGITHPITFPATVNLSGDQATATAMIEVDRTRWDIKYRAALIGTAADKIIEDRFTIDLRLVAGKSEDKL